MYKITGIFNRIFVSNEGLIDLNYKYVPGIQIIPTPLI